MQGAEHGYCVRADRSNFHRPVITITGNGRKMYL